MASSLSAECTPLKHAYDSCFNSWFEGYLQPAVNGGKDDIVRREYSKKKAQEFEEKCGAVWESYKTCVARAAKDKGLDTLLEQARQENPLKEPPPVPPSPAEFSSSPGA